MESEWCVGVGCGQMMREGLAQGFGVDSFEIAGLERPSTGGGLLQASAISIKSCPTMKGAECLGV